jgi:hypothetical protein
MLKNTANQKWVVFAFDLTDNTPKTGDAAQITANLRIDGAAANAIDDTNPTELEDGYYVFDLTQAETNGDNIVICPASSTGDIQVIGCPMAVWTLDLDTKEDIRAEMDSNSTQLTAIAADTNELQTDWHNGGRLDLIIDELTTQGDNNELLLHAISGLIGTPGVDLATDIAGITLGSGMTEATFLAYFLGMED